MCFMRGGNDAFRVVIVSKLLILLSSPTPNHHSACCSFAYLLFGLLCFDRFTSRAFLSTQDPVASTAIPGGGASDYNAPAAVLS